MVKKDKKPATKAPAAEAAGAGKQINVVRLASDALHEVNMLLAGLLPTDPGYNDVEQKRDELEARVKRLVRESLGEATKMFVSANDRLVQVNDRMKADLQSLQNLQRAVEAITGLLQALDGFIAAVFPMPKA